ncbi:ribonuclease P protein subunit p29 isoform X2 [Vulpes lagopus]|uniref:ribonuclease P protein subunit p29 isoform X2 n=1 Tax=Vulpes lagopus TaxID=494514 RepID=UPI001BC8DF4D|nr:ribonuclease P protein subunit p29 isoform X2 [Vulpes lagopus]
MPDTSASCMYSLVSASGLQGVAQPRGRTREDGAPQGWGRPRTQAPEGRLPGAQQAEAFVRAFLKRSMPRMSQQACEDQLQRKAVVLEYFTRRKRKEKRKRSKGLSARQRRELHLFDITAEQQRYSLFLPLHELWKQYIRDLCGGLKPDTQPQMIQAKLLKADLHGALISVTKSKCPSYVGVTGILLQETKHLFKIITKEDRLKVIPKLNCVFTVEIDGFVSYIYGSKFQLRSSERSAKKFKAKGTVDL